MLHHHTHAHAHAHTHTHTQISLMLFFTFNTSALPLAPSEHSLVFRMVDGLTNDEHDNFTATISVQSIAEYLLDVQ